MLGSVWGTHRRGAQAGIRRSLVRFTVTPLRSELQVGDGDTFWKIKAGFVL